MSNINFHSISVVAECIVELSSRWHLDWRASWRINNSKINSNWDGQEKYLQFIHYSSKDSVHGHETRKHDNFRFPNTLMIRVLKSWFLTSFNLLNLVESSGDFADFAFSNTVPRIMRCANRSLHSRIDFDNSVVQFKRLVKNSLWYLILRPPYGCKFLMRLFYLLRTLNIFTSCQFVNFPCFLITFLVIYHVIFSTRFYWTYFQLAILTYGLIIIL